MIDVGSRLFLSCDLVGSTSHKQSTGDTEIWIPDFLRFYYDFPARVRENLDHPALASRLEFWKAVGDELLFTVDIEHENEVCQVVDAWIAAMAQYESELALKNSEENSPVNKMKTKGGAFIATFPDPDYVVAVPTTPMELDSERDVLVRNEEMRKADQPADGRLIDYLGPSIDTGFRVIAACSQRYFTVSLEVAWAMAYHRHFTEHDRHMDGLLLLEERQMKGVWDGRGYPVFAVDRQHRDQIVQKLASVQHRPPVVLEEVVHLAEACKDDPRWPSRVYFKNSGYAEFTRLGPDLARRREHLDSLIDRSGESVAEFTTADGDTESASEDSTSAIEVPEPRA